MLAIQEGSQYPAASFFGFVRRIHRWKVQRIELETVDVISLSPYFVSHWYYLVLAQYACGGGTINGRIRSHVGV
jgi:hypothetical protein